MLLINVIHAVQIKIQHNPEEWPDAHTSGGPPIHGKPFLNFIN